ncbi:hypothetical protein VIAE108258_23025 [Vibrio aerogenes]
MTLAADAAQRIELVQPLVAFAVGHAGEFTFRIVVIIRGGPQRIGDRFQPVKSAIFKALGMAEGVGDFGQVAFNIIVKAGRGAVFINHLRRLTVFAVVTPATDLFVVALALD